MEFRRVSEGRTRERRTWSSQRPSSPSLWPRPAACVAELHSIRNCSVLKYIELKTGFSNDGPAWIARVETSASGKTLYFNNRAFRSWEGRGIGGNYYDVETSETYWISNPKKNGGDRHWAGRGIILIQADIVDDYLELSGRIRLSDRFEITHEVQPTDRTRFHQLENEQPKKGKRGRKRIRTNKR